MAKRAKVCVCVGVEGCGHWWLSGLHPGRLLIERLEVVGMMLSHHFPSNEGSGGTSGAHTH